MCLAQEHNAATPERLKPAALRSRVKHSSTEPLLSHSKYELAEVVKLFFMQLSMKFIMLINVKMPTILNTESLKASQKSLFFSILVFMSS